MDASSKWIKAFVGLKQQQQQQRSDTFPSSTKEAKGVRGPGKKNEKWRKLWRSSHVLVAKKGKPLPPAAAAATRDLAAAKQDCAAVRIQTAFRGFLARRALKALKGLVKLQALARGRLVRKQAAVTLRCMQALAGAQERARARRLRLASGGPAAQEAAEEDRLCQMDPLKEAEDGWCDDRGTLEEIISKLQMRKEGALKRDRAIAYSLSQQNACPASSGGGFRNGINVLHLDLHETDRIDHEWSLLERWMVARTWESRLMETQAGGKPHRTQSSKNSKNCGVRSLAAEIGPVRIRKNNVTTRISAKPPLHLPAGSSCCSASTPSSGLCRDSSCSSSVCTPTLPASKPATGESNESRPGYMRSTESAKTKQRSFSACRTPLVVK